MKKILSFLLVGMLFLIVLSSCSRRAQDEAAPLTGGNFDRKFSEYLDNEGFVKAFTMGYEPLLKNYKYKGEVFTEIVKGPVYDGYFKDGSLSGTKADEEEAYGYLHEARNASDESDYWDKFYTRVPLEGLNLPFGIEFDDKLERVFAKMGIRIDPYREFDPDEDDGDLMTLFGHENASLVLTRLDYLDQYDYTLTYTETNRNATSRHGTRTVERRMKLSFTSEDRLGYFEVTVRDHDQPIVNEN